MSFLTPSKNKKVSSLSDPFVAFQNEMNQLMDSFFTESNWMTEPEVKNMKQWTPRVDLSETDKEYKVKVELPGLDENDIDITFQDNTLYIKGEKKFEKEEETESFHRVERTFGQFYRAVPFAANVDEEKIGAKFDKGVLSINLAKTDDVVNKTRKINIGR